jgi:dihydroxyacetone kinase-like predicted kinase
MLGFKYDTQLLVEGKNLDEDAVNECFTNNFKGDCLLAVGDEDLLKIHFHTNEPWKVLEYCASLGEIYDIVIEDMDRQSRGIKGKTPIYRGVVGSVKPLSGRKTYDSNKAI